MDLHRVCCAEVRQGVHEDGTDLEEQVVHSLVTTMMVTMMTTMTTMIIMMIMMHSNNLLCKGSQPGPFFLFLAVQNSSIGDLVTN